jgi:spore germination protein YaaH
VIWTQLVNASATGGTLTKTGGQPDYDDASGQSKQTIGGDGWLELTVADPDAFRFVGLSHAPGGSAAIDVAIRLQSGRGDIYQNGQWTADNTVVAGDVMRLQVTAGQISVLKNGVQVWASGTAASLPLYASAVLITPGATVTNANMGLPAAQAPDPFFIANLNATATADGALVTWSTPVQSTSRVDYGTTAAYGAHAGGDTPVLQHSVTLTGLSAGTWHYQVSSTDSDGNVVDSPDATFTVAAVSMGAPPSNPNAHKVCGWVMASGYVTPDQDPSYLGFAAAAGDLDAVHPAWWHVTSPTTFATIYGEGADIVLSRTTHAGQSVKLIPMVAAVDGSAPSQIHQMMSDPTLRAQHVAALVQLATANGYDGLDLDYEHLADSDRAIFSQFVVAAAQAMHAAGKTLSFAVGAVSSATSVWDYAVLAQNVDQIHVMGYDYHFLGSHLGPVAPLGWLQQVTAYIGTVGHTDKFILGLPNYGLAGSGSVSDWFGTSADAAALAGANYATTTTHMNSCPFGSQAPGRAPNANTSKGLLFFDDLASFEEKVTLAQSASLGGITEWTMGGEPSGFFPMVRSHFPK